MSDKCINTEKIKEQYSDIMEVFSEIVEIFVSDHEQYIINITNAITSRDFNELRSSSHTVKGVLANLYLEESASIAFKLELLGESNSLENSNELLLELKESIQLSIIELNKFLKTISSE